MLAKAILMHGDIGYKFFYYSLNQRAPVGHESAETPIGNKSTSSKFVWLVRKIQSKWVGKAERKLCIFLTKKYTSDPPSNVFRDSEIDITKRDIKIYKERYFQPLS